MGFLDWLLGEPRELPAGIHLISSSQDIIMICSCGEELRTSGFAGAEIKDGKVISCTRCGYKYSIKRSSH